MGRRPNDHQQPRNWQYFRRPIVAGTVVALMGGIGLLFAAQSAFATATAVSLGTAASYSVLGGASVTNTGSSVLNASLGVSPGTAISGFPPGYAAGFIHAGDAEALQAQEDLTVAYDAVASQALDESVSGDLGGSILPPGVYNASSSIGLTGALTLDAEGDPNAVFVFQIGSTLTTATSSSVVLINGARGCNVFWQVGSSATLGTDSVFVGSILADTSITANTGATIDGRALARNGSVTLDTNTFTGGTCESLPTTPGTDVPTTPGTDGPTTPGTDSPTTPGTDVPTTPGTDGPTTPGTDSPTTPGTDGPTTPGTDSPTTPGTDGPTTPGTDSPTTPGTDGPTTPGTDGPTTPGTDSPTTPGTDSPTTPGTDGPTGPEKTPDTGADIGGPLIAGMLLLGVGATFLGVRRKMLA